MILAVAFAAALKTHKSPVQLPPAMEAKIRAVIEEHLENHPEMKFNVTQLSEVKMDMKDGTSDDTVCFFISYLSNEKYLKG